MLKAIKRLSISFFVSFSRPSDVRENVCREFYLGHSSGPDAYNGDRTVMFDEFHFWSGEKSPDQIKEHGV